MKTRTVGSAGTPDSSRLRADGNQLRIDTAAPPSGQGATSIVFDANTEVLRVYRHAENSYVEIDKEFAAQLGAKMAEAQKMMEAQLAKMPPEQRAMMEKLMKSGAMPFPNPGAKKNAVPLEAKSTAKTETIGETVCTVYTLSRGGTPKGDVCVAAWDTVAIGPNDIKVLKKLGAFQSKMTESLAGAVPGAAQPFELLDRVDGFPLRTRRTEGGKVVSETYFEDLQQAEVDPDAFSIPAGYTKKETAAPGG